MGHILIARVRAPSLVLSHLVPLGSPIALAPFMVVIEMVSSVIRPLTLSVRLTANIVAGHLLITLVRSTCPPSSLALIAAVFVPLILLMLLETAVALIQAYVFSILNILYLKEVDSPEIST